jgi:glycerophosphoryl diester phosphodiesterase
MKHCLKYTVTAGALALSSLSAVPSYAADKTITQIINAMAGLYQGVKIAPTHRGRYRDNNGNSISGVGENSNTAVLDAGHSNALAVEVDVKSSSDNYPIASHDYTIGRITSFNHFGNNQYVGQCNTEDCDYSPYNRNGWNPSIDKTTVTQWTERYARAFDGSATNDHAAIFPNIVQTSIGQGMVPLIDLKNAADEANLAAVAYKGGNQATNSVAKVPMGSYTPKTFANTRSAGYRAAVMANGNANAIIANSPNGSIYTYMSDIWQLGENRTLYFEINLKNDSAGANDPMLPYYNYAVKQGYQIGTFNPVVENGAHGFFKSSDGSCCAQSNVAADWSATSKLGTDPLPDLRANVTWVAAHASVVISDVPSALPIGIW